MNLKLATHDFLKFDWYKTFYGYVGFSFNIFCFRMIVVSVETSEN